MAEEPYERDSSSEPACTISPPLSKLSRSASGYPAETAGEVGRIRIARCECHIDDLVLGIAQELYRAVEEDLLQRARKCHSREREVPPQTPDAQCNLLGRLFMVGPPSSRCGVRLRMLTMSLPKGCRSVSGKFDGRTSMGLGRLKNCNGRGDRQVIDCSQPMAVS